MSVPFLLTGAWRFAEELNLAIGPGELCCNHFVLCVFCIMFSAVFYTFLHL